MVEKYIETLREIASVTEPLKSSKDERALDKLNSFLVLGDGDEDLMEEAGKIAEELTSYGLRIMSYGSVG